MFLPNKDRAFLLLTIVKYTGKILFQADFFNLLIRFGQINTVPSVCHIHFKNKFRIFEIYIIKALFTLQRILGSLYIPYISTTETQIVVDH